MSASTARTLYAIHVENFTAGGLITADDAAHVKAVVEAHAHPGPNDLVVVACRPANAFAVAAAWPTARTLWGHGPHSAGDALADVLADERVADRFERVVLASGSGVFTPAVTTLTAAGRHVTLVARAIACSRRLELAAHEVHLVNQTTPSNLAVAA